MKYALQSSVHVDSIEAHSFHCSSGAAILSFKSGILTGTLSLHIPPSVADATADAFNEAMAEHERQEQQKFNQDAHDAMNAVRVRP